MRKSNVDFDFERNQKEFEKYINSDSDKIIRRRRELQYLHGGNVQPRERLEISVPTRTSVVEFKPAAANRLRRFIDNYYMDFRVMVTLTYGATWPNDGRVVKAHLRAFFERMRRAGWFEKESLVWWLEFQARGAPHLHMVLTGWLSKDFVASAWSEISGAPIESCTRTESLKHADAAGSYASKYAAKSDQKEIPPGYTNVGRFWGCRGARPEGEGSRCPKEVSAATPAQVRGRVRACAGAHVRARERGFGTKGGMYLPPVTIPDAVLGSIRAYEHEGGFSFYGNEWEIDQLWRYLQAIYASTGQRVKGCAGTRLPMSPGYSARP